MLEGRNEYEFEKSKETTMKTVADGNYVKVHYTGRLESGDVFDSSSGCQPLELQVGGGQIIAGFETALMGMGVNEKKTFTLSPGEAYGDRDESAKQSFARERLPEGLEVEVGRMLAVQRADGSQIPAVIEEADDEKIVLDMNHPLAGKSLTFDVEVMEINEQPSEPGCGSCCGCG